jgi:hypothetical protein
MGVSLILHDKCRANYLHIKFMLLIHITFFVHQNYEFVTESLYYILMVLQNTSFNLMSFYQGCFFTTILHVHTPN